MRVRVQKIVRATTWISTTTSCARAEFETLGEFLQAGCSSLLEHVITYLDFGLLISPGSVASVFRNFTTASDLILWPHIIHCSCLISCSTSNLRHTNISCSQHQLLSAPHLAHLENIKEVCLYLLNRTPCSFISVCGCGQVHRDECHRGQRLHVV